MLYQGIFGWNIAHIPHPRDLQKHSPQPRSAPHEFDHDIRTLPRRPTLITTALLQQLKMKGDVAGDLVRMDLSENIQKM
jgi:hypothetical protein